MQKWIYTKEQDAVLLFLYETADFLYYSVIWAQTADFLLTKWDLFLIIHSETVGIVKKRHTEKKGEDRKNEFRA